MSFEVEIRDKDVINALDRKEREANAEVEKYKRKLLNLYRNWAIKEAPRKTGRLKSSHRGEWHGEKGVVFADEHIAPYAEYVLKGTRPHVIEAKGKRALHFMWHGQESFYKRVKHPGTKPNDWGRKASIKAAPERYRLDKDFINWAVKL